MWEIRQHSEVEKYLNRVEIENYKDFKKLTTLINKLSEKGKEALILSTYKKIKEHELDRCDVVVIQIKINRKKYRIHTLLTKNYLYLLNAFDKKKNKTPPNEIEKTLSRAKQITKF